MRKPVKINSKTKTVTSTQRQREFNQVLFSKSTPEIVSDFLTEKRCKNRAYEFIADNGLMDKFYEFSKRRF